MQEYDSEIKPNKLVKGQGLCKLTTEELDPQEDEEAWENEANMLESEVFYIRESTNLWYNDLKYYLRHGRIPSHLDA